MIAQAISKTSIVADRPDLPDRARLKAFLFDLDGTLYRLRPVQMAVLRTMLPSFFFHPLASFRTMRAITAYRRSQELLRTTKILSRPLREEQVHMACELSHLPKDFVETCVTDWMENKPLQFISRFAQKGLIQVFQTARQSGILTAVCSDYPAHRKIDALGLTEWIDLVISAQDPEIGEFKPSPRMLTFALEKLGVAPEHALFIGDRVDVDGAAAQRAGVAFHLLDGHQDLHELIFDKTSGYRFVGSNSCHN